MPKVLVLISRHGNLQSKFVKYFLTIFWANLALFEQGFAQIMQGRAIRCYLFCIAQGKALKKDNRFYPFCNLIIIQI